MCAFNKYLLRLTKCQILFGVPKYLVFQNNDEALICRICLPAPSLSVTICHLIYVKGVGEATIWSCTCVASEGPRIQLVTRTT